MPTLLNHFPHKQDDRIRQDVLRQLIWQTDIQSEEIEVEVQNSAVALSGCVETRFDKMEAENAAKVVFGVSSVTNNIRIEPKRSRSDSEVRDDVAAGLRRMTCVLEEIPAVSVRDGVVTLRGTMRWNFQRLSAERVADAVVGTRMVRNLIEIEPLTEEKLSRPQSRNVPAAALLPPDKNGGHSTAA
jgi:osmotically-inducible protein OsmY